MKYVKRRIPNNKGRKYINELTFFSILSLFNQNEISFKLTSTDLFFYKYSRIFNFHRHGIQNSVHQLPIHLIFMYLRMYELLGFYIHHQPALPHVKLYKVECM